MEDIYKYNDVIFTETSFKQIHPLLFTSVDDIIDVVKKNENNKIIKKIDIFK